MVDVRLSAVVEF